MADCWNRTWRNKENDYGVGALYVSPNYRARIWRYQWTVWILSVLVIGSPLVAYLANQSLQNQTEKKAIKQVPSLIGEICTLNEKSSTFAWGISSWSLSILYRCETHLGLGMDNNPDTYFDSDSLILNPSFRCISLLTWPSNILTAEIGTRPWRY